MRSPLLFSCRCAAWVAVLCVVVGLAARAQPTLAPGGSSLDPPPRPNASAPDAAGRWVPSLRSIGRDALDVAAAPVGHARRHPARLAAATGLTVAIAATVDDAVHAHFSAPGAAGPSVAVPRALAGPGRVYDRVGTMRSGLGTAALFAAGGLVRGDRHMTRTSVHVVQALALAEVTTGLAKTLAGRYRPGTGAGALEAAPVAINGGTEVFSFPSGHTSKAFAVAAVVARSTDRWYVQVPAYTIAASGALQRIESGKHWATDVLAGAALGYLIGRTVTGDRASSSGIDYRPIVSSGRLGFSIHF
jgi:membrane-associated phospholipid phosphatase